MHRTLTGSLTGAMLALACLVSGVASAAAPPLVSVRLEGVSHTLLAQTTLSATNATTIKGHKCSGSSAAGGLDVATHGDWSGSFSSQFKDYSVVTILRESHPFLPGPDYWTLWVNGRSSSTGACATRLHTGDHELWFVCKPGPAPAFSCTNNPLAVIAPPATRAGSSITVRVVQLDGAGHSTAFAGAIVSGAGGRLVTDSQGRARFTPAKPGTLVLQARKAGATPSDPATVCVSNHPAACSNDSGGPRVHVSGISEHERFSAKHAPRKLHGSAGPAPSGLSDVRLSLTRRAPSGRCSYYDGSAATWRGRSCHAAAPSFSVGPVASWSYFLPAPLGAGSYRLDVIARDGYGRQTKLATGVSQIDFSVT